MKRSTSIKNVVTIAARLKNCSGLIGTPNAHHEALRVSRAWVFGSTAKGSPTPNDTDILLEFKPVGRINRSATRDKYAYRAYGWKRAVSSASTAKKYLRAQLKMVRLHDIECDGELPDIQATKILIYPRMDFNCN